MRLSVLPDDPGYSPLAATRSVVLIDGRPEKYCVMADEERGEALCYVKDAGGKLVRAAPGEPQIKGMKVETRRGRVVVRFAPEAGRA